MLFRWYKAIILERPLWTLLLIFCAILFFGYYAPKFHLDASSDTLVLENNKALEYYRSISARYESDDYVVIAYTPHDNTIFDSNTLADIKAMRNALADIDGVTSVVSIYDVPLLHSPPVTFDSLTKKIITLDSDEVDIGLAEQEFKTSPLYSNLLMSEDGTTTAMLVTLEQDAMYNTLRNERNALREERLSRSLTPEEDKALVRATEAFSQYKQQALAKQTKAIADIRAVMDAHRDHAMLYLGGVPMIVVDSIDYISSDIVVFGVGVVCFLIVLLVLAFRDIRWVLLSMINCTIVAVVMIGMLGLLGWPVTAVSSNFLSLLLIITLSLAVHLIVHYRELVLQMPEAKQSALVSQVVEQKFMPCFYTSATTMVAFSSFLISGIRPVIDFGLMMTIGMAVAFICSFTFFPAALVLMSKITHVKGRDITGHITLFFADINQRFKGITLCMFAVVAVVSVVGMSWLTVENRFIDYYKESTDIYQGMELIDTKLGGTTPMDVILDAPSSEESDEAGKHPDITEGYWYNSFMLDEIAMVHSYLESLPQTGKVLSFDTTMQMVKSIDKRSYIDSLFLAVLAKELPANIKTILFDPYISKDGNQLRFSTRVFESDSTLRRQELIDSVKAHLTDVFEYMPEQVHVTGMVVLYNDLLQSLFRSQILTLGFVFSVILVMFVISFHSIKLALIAIIPNIFASLTVLGIMGLWNIPLDIMTITIAAICIGIAVDNTIHYVHRFKKEYGDDKNYWQAMKRAHGTIGHAMYYTAITITLGFSILVLSNFVPTVYFGLLTGFSMLVALLADLLLLPLLLVLLKPFKT